jgi:hypothetical protein
VIQEAGMFSERAQELLGMLMIGDGVLALAEPRRHALLWRAGPAWWRELVDPFVDRPALTRALGAAGALFGLWLASRQQPRWEADWDAGVCSEDARAMMEAVGSR